MMSRQNPSPTDVAPGPTRTDRGIATEAAAAASDVAAPTPGWPDARPTHFWSSVIAGTLFVLSVFVLSWFLMLGCHVGVNRAGTLSMGWGAPWWVGITSAIAFYLGRTIANNISHPLGSGWLKGSTIWGLSIPLALCVWSVSAGRTGLLRGLNTPQVNVLGNAHTFQAATRASMGGGVAFGVVWTVFTMLIVGLIFSNVGSRTASGAAGGPKTMSIWLHEIFLSTRVRQSD